VSELEELGEGGGLLGPGSINFKGGGCPFGKIKAFGWKLNSNPSSRFGLKVEGFKETPTIGLGKLAFHQLGLPIGEPSVF